MAPGSISARSGPVRRTIGKTPGRVVRHIEEGFAVEFIRLQHPDFLEEIVTGW
jgi:hypothetical protein